jgi:hypothetical protein
MDRRDFLKELIALVGVIGTYELNQLASAEKVESLAYAEGDVIFRLAVFQKGAASRLESSQAIREAVLREKLKHCLEALNLDPGSVTCKFMENGDQDYGDRAATGVRVTARSGGSIPIPADDDPVWAPIREVWERTVEAKSEQA